MFLFYVLSFFIKGGTIQGGTLFKGGHYLYSYSIQKRQPLSLAILGPFMIIFFRQLHYNLSQNLGADDQFEVLNMSKSWLDKNYSKKHKFSCFIFFFNFGRKNPKNLWLINGHFLTIFANCTKIFNKPEAQTVLLRCLVC